MSSATSNDFLCVYGCFIWLKHNCSYLLWISIFVYYLFPSCVCTYAHAHRPGYICLWNPGEEKTGSLKQVFVSHPIQVLGPNLGPLKKYCMLLTTVQSLQLPSVFLINSVITEFYCYQFSQFKCFCWTIKSVSIQDYYWYIKTVHLPCEFFWLNCISFYHLLLSLWASGFLYW